MRTKLYIITITILLISCLFSACKKYDEGPVFSLKSKTTRLKGDWNLVFLEETSTFETRTSLQSKFDGKTFTLVNGNETFYLNNFTQVISFKSDKIYTRLTNYKIENETVSDTTTSDWAFYNKDELKLDIEYYTIKRLTSKDLIIEQKLESGDTKRYVRLEFKKK
jgi:hypothetical protein